MQKKKSKKKIKGMLIVCFSVVRELTLVLRRGFSEFLLEAFAKIFRIVKPYFITNLRDINFVLF